MMDRDAYLKSRSNFAGQQDQIYDLFEKYTKRKRELGDRDAADRYVNIYIIRSSLCSQSLA